MRARIIGAVCGALISIVLFAAMFFNWDYVVLTFFAVVGTVAFAVAGFCFVAAFQKANRQ